MPEDRHPHPSAGDEQATHVFAAGRLDWLIDKTR